MILIWGKGDFQVVIIGLELTYYISSVPHAGDCRQKGVSTQSCALLRNLERGVGM